MLTYTGNFLETCKKVDELTFSSISVVTHTMNVIIRFTKGYHVVNNLSVYCIFVTDIYANQPHIMDAWLEKYHPARLMVKNPNANIGIYLNVKLEKYYPARLKVYNPNAKLTFWFSFTQHYWKIVPCSFNGLQSKRNIVFNYIIVTSYS